ncbi:kinesin-like protein KIF25 isoform X2 [Paroedura picta]|uniref:kinesin-like protein KIF25 isoform X2 n=1 Tax=Paroedura picta TaxID=143630 RepID=UPI0040564091
MDSSNRHNDMTPEDEPLRSEGVQYATGDEQTASTSSARMNEAAGPKPKGRSVVEVTGGEKTVRCCKDFYSIGTWNVRSMNQGKLDVVKQEMRRLNIDILGISELKWTGMGEFNSDDHQSQSMIGKSSTKELPQSYVNCRLCSSHGSAWSSVSQLYGAIQRLKQDMKNLHLSALALAKGLQHQSKNSFYQILAAVRRLQLHNEDMATFQIKALELEQSLLDVSERYQKEKETRKILHNSLIELRGNIRVHCRIRPLLPLDTAPGELVLEDRHRSLSEKVVCAADEETVLIKCSRPGHALINKILQFERVYSPAETQETVFADVSPLLTSLLDGYNVCIMAYGQTGSGKTYTMLGPQPEENFAFLLEEEPELGIIPRAAEEVFRLISEKPPGSHWVEVSVIEVYNNDVFDLLAKDNYGTTIGVKRDIVTNKEGKSDVPLLVYEPVEDAVEFMELVQKGLQLRVKHPTLVHAHSSRSHLVVTLTIMTKAVLGDGFGDCSSRRLNKEHFFNSPQSVNDDKPTYPSRSSSPAQFLSESTEKHKQMRTKLLLVDLAGSECVGMSGVTGAVLRETSFINRSLSALADVLAAISENRSHVPYRNSKLTHLLQDSIGGDAKLLLVLCVSPSPKYITESLQTLGFGTRARQVQRGQAKKRNQPGPSKSK